MAPANLTQGLHSCVWPGHPGPHLSWSLGPQLLPELCHGHNGLQLLLRTDLGHMCQVTLFPLLPVALTVLSGPPNLTDGFPFPGAAHRAHHQHLALSTACRSCGTVPYWWGHCLGCGRPHFLVCSLSLSSPTHAAPWHCFGKPKYKSFFAYLHKALLFSRISSCLADSWHDVKRRTVHDALGCSVLSIFSKRHLIVLTLMWSQMYRAVNPDVAH